MKTISVSTEAERRLALLGILFCFSSIFFVLFASLTGISVSMLSGFKPEQTSSTLVIRTSDDNFYSLDPYTGNVQHQFALNYRPESSLLSSFESYTNDNNTIYYQGYRGIYAAHIQSGQLLWKRYLTDSSFDTTPTALMGNILFAQNKSTIYALRPNDGTLLWQHDIATDFKAKLITFSYPELLSNNVVCFSINIATSTNSSPSSALYALNAKSGSYLWEKAFTDPSKFASTNEVLYIADGTTLYEYRLQDGVLLWKRKEVEFIQSITISGDFIYVSASTDTSPFSTSGSIFTLRLRDHSFAWISKNANVIAITPDLVYGRSTTTNQTLVLQPEDGHPLWNYEGTLLSPTNGNTQGAFRLAYGDRPLPQLSPQTGMTGFFIEALDTHTGAIQWQQRIYAQVSDSLLSKNFFFLISQNFVYAFSANTGQFLWQRQFNILLPTNNTSTLISFLAVHGE